MIRVLIPTDFSDHSYNALSYAHLLLQEVPVEFTLFNACEATALQLLGNKSLKEQSLKKLKALKAQIEGRDDVKNHRYVIQVFEGHLREGIEAFSPKDFDFIIMGSKGATGLKEVFIGTITQSIVSLHQEIPLLIIPEKASFRAPDSIGFATDFARDYTIQELAPLLKLTKLWKSTVRMVEVYDAPSLSPEQKDHLQHLESLLMDVNYRFHVIPEFSSLENCINTFNTELEIDLMTLIDYPKNFFERLMREPLIKKMTFHTTLPFLILPAQS